MKTQNTLENKAKFFAQYFGQEIAEITKGNYTHKIGSIELINSTVLSLVTSERILKIKYKLKLKPISKISDEDALGVYNSCKQDWLLYSFRSDKPKIDKGRCIAKDVDNGGTYWFPGMLISVVDFLRSKGYALPWMDLSVEDLIEYGWIKLEE